MTDASPVVETSIKASVIIPTYRDWHQVLRCLEALSMQDLDTREFEVIIANNNTEETIPSVLALGPNVSVVWQPNPGSYAARNAAVRAARGKFLFFTDADCRPLPNWLSRGLEVFNSGSGCRRIAGRILIEPDTGVWNGWSIYDSVFNLRQSHYVNRGYAVTANLAVERSLFDEVGPFRENVFSGEDMEWNRRASAAGIPILFDGDMCVSHPARKTFSECAAKTRRRAGARFIAKAGHPWKQRIPRLHYVVPSITAFARIWRWPVEVSVGARLKAMWCHYVLGWVYNAEIIRLGLLGGAPMRR